jgi:hypothetical protein
MSTNSGLAARDVGKIDIAAVKMIMKLGRRDIGLAL